MKTKKNDNANLENKRGILFSIGLVTALGFVLLAFELKTTPTPVKIVSNSGTSGVEVDYFPPIIEKVSKPAKPVIDVQTIEIVDDAQKVSDTFEIAGSEITENPLDFTISVFKLPDEKTDNTNEIFVIAEQMPEFPGGQLALMKYLANSIKYPVIAQENGIQGKVYVSFVINETGGIQDITLLRGVDPSLNKEALRVVKSLPNWKPGKQGGKAVKVRYSVPILFELK